MKKLMYLFVAAIMFAFTACGGGETATEEAAPADIDVVEDVAPAEEVADTVAAEEAEDTEEVIEEAAE